MFASFDGATSATLRRTMNLPAGIFVCIGLLAMGIATVVYATQKLAVLA